MADYYYGMLVPWYQVHYRNIESYKRDGERTLIGLEGDSSIDIDWKNLRYTVKVNGVEVAKDGSTFCPIGSDRIAFYSRAGAQLEAPLPAGWNPKEIAGLALFTDRMEEAAISISQGKLRVDSSPGRPIIVFRDGAAARKRMNNLKPPA